MCKLSIKKLAASLGVIIYYYYYFEFAQAFFVLEATTFSTFSLVPPPRDLRLQGPFSIRWPFKEVQIFAKFRRYLEFQFPSSDPLGSLVSLLELLQRLVLILSLPIFPNSLSLNLLSTLLLPGTAMSSVRNLLLFLPWTVMSGLRRFISRSVCMVKFHNIFTSSLSVIPTGLCSYHLLLNGRS